MADRPVTAELDETVLEILDSTAGGIRLDTWESYSINSNFLCETDGWSLTLGDDTSADKVIATLKPGMRIRARVSGHTQLTGYIHDVKVHSSRAGTNVTIEGQDCFYPVVKGTMDPTVRFTAGQTVYDLLKAIFGPFGFTSDASFIVRGLGDGDGDDLRQRLGTSHVKTSKKGRPLKSYVLHQLRPYPHEGCFQFASRICQRYGFWIWPSADGNAVVCGTPNFDTEPLYKFTNKRGANVDELFNNVIESESCFSDMDQPALIIATGFGSGGEAARSGLKVAMINELTLDPTNGSQHPDVVAALAKHKDAVLIPYLGTFSGRMRYKQQFARILYLHDDDSKSLEQLQAFVRREMAKLQRKTLTYDVTVRGHSQFGAPYIVDRIADVQDDVCNVHEPMWILDRTFTKSRKEGTITKMQLIRPYTLNFESL